MDCKTCKENHTSVSYIVHESSMARMERVNKRLWIVVIILALALIGTNAGWVYYENQFEDVVVTQEALTDDGGDAIANGTANGDVYYGEGETDNKSAP